MNIIALVVAIAISELAGAIGSIFTVRTIPTWYAGLRKPSFNPPSWVFGPVWTMLYLLMGIAAYLVWLKHPLPVASQSHLWQWAIGLFAVQLILNVLWPYIFFGRHNIGGAVVEIIMLWLAILATIIVFARISPAAGWLLVPYIVWVSFASILNFTIWKLNK